MEKELPKSGGLYVRTESGKLQLVSNEAIEPQEPEPVEPETDETQDEE